MPPAGNNRSKTQSIPFVTRKKLFELTVSCAAKVLLCAITNVGLFNCWITFAMVKGFPDP